MDKITWIRHMIDSEGLRRIIDGGDPMEWTQARLKHKRENCPQCYARRQTKQASMRVRDIRKAYSDLGMIRVRGAMGGVYYE